MYVCMVAVYFRFRNTEDVRALDGADLHGHEPLRHIHRIGSQGSRPGHRTDSSLGNGTQLYICLKAPFVYGDW
jgi:hypothetical protein